MGWDSTEHDEWIAGQKAKLGATNEFPGGKLNDVDEGELQFLIGAKDGIVFLDFGKNVSWIGMSPEDAVELAEGLIKSASVAVKEQKH